jgi:hypothetical protein
MKIHVVVFWVVATYRETVRYDTNVSEYHTVSIFRVKTEAALFFYHIITSSSSL